MIYHTLKRERNDRIAELWIAGVKGAAIAAEVGCTRSAVLGVVHRRGLVGHPAHPSLNISPKRARPIVIEPPPITPPEPQPDVPGGFVSIIDIRTDQCRWLIDGVRYKGLPVFCGKPVHQKDGRAWSWCPKHHRAAISIQKYIRAKERT